MYSFVVAMLISIREERHAHPLEYFILQSRFPYEGAKEHFVLDIEKRDLLDRLIPRAVPPLMCRTF